MSTLNKVVNNLIGTIDVQTNEQLYFRVFVEGNEEVTIESLSKALSESKLINYDKTKAIRSVTVINHEVLSFDLMNFDNPLKDLKTVTVHIAKEKISSYCYDFEVKSQ